jgi:putative DNA-invertase from lambdoid prophage Rac
MADERLIPYIRQSRKKEKTISLDSQREKVEGWARLEGVALADEVVEQGVSGSRHWKERGIGEAIEAVVRGEASGIVVAYQSRLTRENGLGTAEVYDALKASGARLVCVNESIDTSKGNPDDTEMMFSINAAIARREWARARSNFGEGVAKAQERGVYIGPTPTGFGRVDGLGRGEAADVHPKNKDGRLVKNADSVAVEQAFRVRAARGSYSEMARVLEKAGVCTPGGAERWSTSSLRALIANPIYRGDNGRYHFEEYEVVPAEVWAAARPKPNPRGADGKLERNGRQDGGKRLLGGLIFCSACGHRMAPTRTTSHGKTHHYFQCKHSTCEAQAYANAGKIEALAERDFLGAVAYAPVPHAPDLTPLASEVALARTGVEQWQEAVDSGAFSPADALRGLQKARERQAEAEQALWQAREEAGLNDERLTLAERWPQLDTEERRRILKRFGAKVIVQRGKEPIHERAFLTFSDLDAYREAATSADFEPDVVIEGLPDGQGTVWEEEPARTAAAGSRPARSAR